ncbi:hypothetical protein JW935_26145 [candidate division KSB1 bacterium]|nr:hypothetical protein [candidate division KSB1 bacterium]
MFFWGESFEFLLGPALLFYTLILAYREYRLRLVHLLHLIPFAVHLVFYSTLYHIYSAEIKRELLNRYLLTYSQYILNSIAIYSHFIIYTAIALLALYGYRKELKNQFSSLTKIKLTWLSFLLFGFFSLWGLGFINFIFGLNGLPQFLPTPLFVLLVFLFANFIVFKGLKQPEIFSGIELPERKKNTNLPKDLSRQYLEKIKSYMEKEKPYLEPTISLNNLAQRIAISPRYISHIINNSLDQNFLNFINSYRIKESQQLFTDPQHKNKTVLERCAGV